MRLPNGHCIWFRHDWDKRRVTIPLFSTDKGILMTCSKCDKVVAK